MNDATRATPQPRAVDGGRGITWWSDAWALFMKSPGLWVVFGVVLLVFFIVLAMIPVLGALAASVLAPVFIGGWLLAARKVEAGGTLEIGDLLLGFKEKLQPLLILGALLLAAAFVMGLVVAALGFGSAGMMTGGVHSGGAMAVAMGAGMLAMLVTLVLGFLVAVAFWYAPALVVFRDVAPVDALKASVAASLKNVVAFLLYGILYIVAAMLATITFGLGWIVLIPVMMLSVYVSYRDVFGA